MGWGVGLSRKTIITRSTQATQAEAKRQRCSEKQAVAYLRWPHSTCRAGLGQARQLSSERRRSSSIQVPGGSPKDCALVRRPVFCFLCFLSILDTWMYEVGVGLSTLTHGLLYPIFDSPMQLAPGSYCFQTYKLYFTSTRVSVSQSWGRMSKVQQAS